MALFFVSPYFGRSYFRPIRSIKNEEKKEKNNYNNNNRISNNNDSNNSCGFQLTEIILVPFSVYHLIRDCLIRPKKRFIQGYMSISSLFAQHYRNYNYHCSGLIQHFLAKISILIPTFEKNVFWELALMLLCFNRLSCHLITEKVINSMIK